MDFVGESALVRAKHDGVRGAVHETGRGECLVSGDKLHVGTTAREAVSELDVKL